MGVILLVPLTRRSARSTSPRFPSWVPFWLRVVFRWIPLRSQVYLSGPGQRQGNEPVNLYVEWLNSWGRAGLCLSISVHLHQAHTQIFHLWLLVLRFPVVPFPDDFVIPTGVWLLVKNHIVIILFHCFQSISYSVSLSVSLSCCLSYVVPVSTWLCLRSWLCLLSSGMTIPEEDTEAGQTGKYCLVAIGRLQVCILVCVCAIIITTEIKKRQ